MATSLPPSFTLADIKELHHLRWGIETSFRDLKYTLGLVDLHGRSDAFAEADGETLLGWYRPPPPQCGHFFQRPFLTVKTGVLRKINATPDLTGGENGNESERYRAFPNKLGQNSRSQAVPPEISRGDALRGNTTSPARVSEVRRS